MNYSANRNDCVQFILDSLHLEYKKTELPANWYHEKNLLIEDTIKLINNGLPFRIAQIIFSPQSLLDGDIIFMRFRGKFVHHLAKYIGNKHIEHCMPNRGICKDFLRERFFVFGVRIQWVADYKLH